MTWRKGIVQQLASDPNHDEGVSPWYGVSTVLGYYGIMVSTRVMVLTRVLVLVVDTFILIRFSDQNAGAE